MVNPTASSTHSSSGNFNSTPVFGKGNQMRNPFALETTVSANPFGPSIGTSNANGQTSGFSLFAPFGYSSSTSVAGSGSLHSGLFGCPPVIGQRDEKVNPFALKPSGSANLLGSPGGTSSSHGTSTWAFGHTSPPLSSSTMFGAPSSCGFGSPLFLSSSTANGSEATRPPFSSQQPNFGGQVTGSRVALYKKTAKYDSKVPDSTIPTYEDKYVSISAVPVYQDKSHEELRWEDYKSNIKGVCGFNFSTLSGLPFGYSTSTTDSFTSSSTNTCSSTLPLNTFKPFVPGPLNHDPFTFPTPNLSITPSDPNSLIDPFASLATHASSISSPPVECWQKAETKVVDSEQAMDINGGFTRFLNCPCTCNKHGKLLVCDASKFQECCVASEEGRVLKKKEGFDVLSGLTKVMLLVTLLCVCVLIVVVLFKIY